MSNITKAIPVNHGFEVIRSWKWYFQWPQSFSSRALCLLWVSIGFILLSIIFSSFAFCGWWFQNKYISTWKCWKHTGNLVSEWHDHDIHDIHVLYVLFIALLHCFIASLLRGDIWPGIPLFTGTLCRSVGADHGGITGTSHEWVTRVSSYEWCWNLTDLQAHCEAWNIQKSQKFKIKKNNSLPASDLLFMNFSVWPGVDPGKGGTCDLTLVDLWAESIQANEERNKNLRH